MPFLFFPEHHHKFSIELGQASNLNKENWFDQLHKLGEFLSYLTGHFSYSPDLRFRNRQFRTEGLAVENLASHYFDSMRKARLPKYPGVNDLCAIKKNYV